jgi:hypothetical protein
MVSESKLKMTYRRNPSARAVIDYFATLDEAVTKANVSLIVNELPHQHQHRQNVIAFLKDLEEWKLGDFKAGRRGHDSRFESSTNLCRIAQMANLGMPMDRQPDRDGTEESDNVKDIVASNGDRAFPPVSNRGLHQHDLTHQFLLRPDYLLTIKLPLDLTKAEAVRLSDFVKSLPFE